MKVKSLENMSEKITTLRATVRKYILSLNNDLPDDVGAYWLTIKELHDRLIYSGVDRSLDISLVENALRHNNKGEKYLKRSDWGIDHYYRSINVHVEDSSGVSPKDQRLENGRPIRIFFMPERDYFIGRGNEKFEAINSALIEIEHELLEEKERAQSAPPEMKSVGLQVEPQSKWVPTQPIQEYDGNCLMSVTKMEELIHQLSGHSAVCGMELLLVQRDLSQGAYLIERWKCPVCLKEIELRNCDMAKTDEVAQGAAFS